MTMPKFKTGRDCPPMLFFKIMALTGRERPFFHLEPSGVFLVSPYRPGSALIVIYTWWQTFLLGIGLVGSALWLLAVQVGVGLSVRFGLFDLANSILRRARQ